MSLVQKRMRVKEYIVFDGLRGWEHNGVTYRLAVSGQVIASPQGELFCSWMSGSNQEPAEDNCPLFSRSTDGGQTWSEPKILYSTSDMPSAGTITSARDDGRLIAQVCHWAHDYTECYWFQIESSDGGDTWSEPKPTPAPIDINNPAFYDGLVAQMVNFFRTGEIPFPPTETMAVVNILESALESKKPEAG